MRWSRGHTLSGSLFLHLGIANSPSYKALFDGASHCAHVCLDIDLPPRVCQYHCDWHAGEDAARRLCYPTSERVADFAHFIGAYLFQCMLGLSDDIGFRLGLCFALLPFCSPFSCHLRMLDRLHACVWYPQIIHFTWVFPLQTIHFGVFPCQFFQAPTQQANPLGMCWVVGPELPSPHRFTFWGPLT